MKARIIQQVIPLKPFNTVIIACLVLAMMLFVKIPLLACGGTPAPPCTGKAVFLAKFTPAVVVLPAAGPIAVPVGLLPFAFWDTRPFCPMPTSASVSLTLTCVPSGAVIGPMTTTLPTPVFPGPQPLAGPVIFTIPAGTFPPGTPPQLCTVMGTYTVSFSDGVTLSFTGDTEVCLVPPTPLDASKPRLEMRYISEDGGLYRTCRRGDQAVFHFLIANNDHENSVSLDFSSIGRQVAHLPDGVSPQDAYANGVYAISFPESGTDTYPAAFADDLSPGELLPEPDPFVVDPQMLTRSLTLQPCEAVIIGIVMRSYGMCANGSCNERLVKLEGSFSNGDPALACASTLYVVDTAEPKSNLCEYSDFIKAGPSFQATWSPGVFFNSLGPIPHAQTFYAGNLPPPSKGFQTIGNPTSNFPQQAFDYIRLTEAPTQMRYQVFYQGPPCDFFQPGGFNNVVISGLGTGNPALTAFPAVSYIEPLPGMDVNIDVSTDQINIGFQGSPIFQGQATAFFQNPPPQFCVYSEICRVLEKQSDFTGKTIHVLPPVQASLFVLPDDISPDCDTFEVFNQDNMPAQWNATINGSGLNLPATSGLGSIEVCYTGLGALPLVPATTLSFVNITCPGALNNPVSVPVAIRVKVVDCEGVFNGQALPGTACDDMNPATTNDVWDNDCNCAGTVGTIEVNGRNIELKTYPNPFTGFVTIEFEAAFNHTLKVSDAHGRSLMTKKSQARKDRLNLENYPAGLYSVSVFDDGFKLLVAFNIKKL
jgi:hypothetical protein